MSTEGAQATVQIRLNPEISSWRTDQKPDKELVADIQERGQVEAITARRLQDGSLEIISGNRRYNALKELGKKPEEMNISILENVNDEDAILMAISGNRYRKDFTAIEEARAFKTLRTMKMRIEKIAKKVGRSESYVRDRLDILDLSKDVQKMIETGKVEASYTGVLKKLKDFPEAQLKLAHKIAQTDYGGIHSVKEAEEQVTQVFAEKDRREKLVATYGLCPKCSGNNIEEAWPKGHLTCKNKDCGYEWDAQTKDPWAIYELKRKAEEQGLKLDIVGPNEAKLSPAELIEIVDKQKEKLEQVEKDSINPTFRSSHTVSELLMPLIAEDNVLSFTVDGDSLNVKLVQESGLHFNAQMKPYKTGEKSRITVEAGWHGEEDNLEHRVPAAKKYDETLTPAR